MNSPVSPNALSTLLPTRVMMCMFTTTYGESVISTPILDSGEPIGPMEKGITYIVRPFMQPRYRSVMVCLQLGRVDPVVRGARIFLVRDRR